MTFLRRLVYKLAAAVFAVLVILYVRSDVNPERWSPAPLPALTGEFSVEPGDGFINAAYLRVPTHGPEDVTIDPQGRLVTGLSDGSIVRFDQESGQTEELVNTGGRPLGLQYDSSDNLIIADGKKGLLLLRPDGRLDVLTDQVNGTPMRLVDDLDIAADGTIWFSDASRRFGLDNYMKDILEASFTGRLLSYSPRTGETTVHMDGLYFANGVALGPDDEFVLVNETGTGRIHRLWLSTAKKGERDVFHDGLPGHPDNLSFNGVDTFWVALPALRSSSREKTSNSVFIRKLLGGLPASRLNVPTSVGFVVGLDVSGKVTHVLYKDPAVVSAITSVNEYGGQLAIGSLTSEQIMRLPVPTPRL
ncbi:MAG: SMP-30/gluconolactonase/LRE family protein [Gammaproteobacteria bacterium]